MMPQQFDLILTNRWKSAVLILAIVVVSLPLMVGAIAVFSNYNRMIGLLAILLAGATFVFLPERLAKRFSSQAAVAIIDDTGLIVQHESTDAVRRINFADMASYSTGINFDFTICPREGKRLKLHLNHKLHPQGLGPMLDMQQHFNWAVADYQRQHPDQPPIPNLGFFDRRGAVVLLVLFAGSIVWLGWRAFQPFASEGVWGGFLFGGLLFTIYALVWQHHRSKTSK